MDLFAEYAEKYAQFPSDSIQTGGETHFDTNYCCGLELKDPWTMQKEAYERIYLMEGIEMPEVIIEEIVDFRNDIYEFAYIKGFEKRIPFNQLFFGDDDIFKKTDLVQFTNYPEMKQIDDTQYLENIQLYYNYREKFECFNYQISERLIDKMAMDDNHIFVPYYSPYYESFLKLNEGRKFTLIKVCGFIRRVLYEVEMNSGCYTAYVDNRKFRMTKTMLHVELQKLVYRDMVITILMNEGFLDVLLVTGRLITFEMPTSDLLWVMQQMVGIIFVNCFGDKEKRKRIQDCLLHNDFDDQAERVFSLKYGNNILQLGIQKGYYKIIKKVVNKGAIKGITMDTLFKEKEVLKVIDHVIDKFQENKVFPEVRLCTVEEISKEFDNTLIKEIGRFIIDVPGLAIDIPHILEISADLAEIKNMKDILDALQLMNVPFECGAVTYSERIDIKLQDNVFKQNCQRFKKTLGSRLLFRTGFDLQDYYLAVKFSLGKKKFRFKMMRCYRLNDIMVGKIARFLNTFNTYIGVQEYILGCCGLLVPYLELVDFIKQVYCLRSRPGKNDMEEIRVELSTVQKNRDNFRKYVNKH